MGKWFIRVVLLGDTSEGEISDKVLRGETPQSEAEVWPHRGTRERSSDLHVDRSLSQGNQAVTPWHQPVITEGLLPSSAPSFPRSDSGLPRGWSGQPHSCSTQAGEPCTERIRGRLCAGPQSITTSEASRWACHRWADSGHRTKRGWGTSLVVQWLRICLAMKGTRIQSRVRELSPTSHGAAKPVHQLLSLCGPTRESVQRREAPRDPAKVLCAATGTQCSQVSEQADKHSKRIRGEDLGRCPGKETISHGRWAFWKNEMLGALAPSPPLYSKPSSLLSRVTASPSHSPLPKQAMCVLMPLRHFVPWLRGALLALRRPSAPIHLVPVLCSPASVSQCLLCLPTVLGAHV